VRDAMLTSLQIHCWVWTTAKIRSKSVKEKSGTFLAKVTNVQVFLSYPVYTVGAVNFG